MVHEVKWPDKRTSRANFSKRSPGRQTDSPLVFRLLGRTIDSPGVVKSEWIYSGVSVANRHFLDARLILLNGKSSLVCLSFDLSGAVSQAEKLSSTNTVATANVLRLLGLETLGDYTVKGVVASVSDVSLGLESLVRDSWLHFEAKAGSMEYWMSVLSELAVRVGLERILLQKALNSSAQQPFRSIVAYSRVRRWPVELMPDKTVVRDLYRDLRASLNEPALRAEILERAKVWWVVFASILSVAGLIVALLGIWVK